MSSWVDEALEALASAKSHGYSEGPDSSEPVAWSAMALVAHDQGERAAQLLDWLIARQSSDGSIGIDSQNAHPGWPTALAVLAWRAADHKNSSQSPRFAGPTNSAIGWLLRVAGVAVAPSAAMGHDPSLVGWPWVLGTHSWIEPTALAVLALKATGHGEHPRAREAVSLLIDRLLPTGGCNYGNTTVLGQMLRPQLQPSGITLCALADEDDPAGRILATQDYLSRNLTAESPAASLAYAILGLTACDRVPHSSPQWLESAYDRTRRRGFDALRIALVLMAAAGDRAAVINLIPKMAGP